jgi:hypothetical protein
VFYDNKKDNIILWFEWKKTFIPKDTINTQNKEIIKPKCEIVDQK